MTPHDFCGLQHSCPSLEDLRFKTMSGEVEEARNGSTYRYLWEDDLLYWKCLSSNCHWKVYTMSLIIPKECHPVILRVAHEGPMDVHFSHRKTHLRISKDFFWPGMDADIRDYCRSCDKCPRMLAKGRLHPVPLQPLPIVTEPFLRIAIDLVGPVTAIFRRAMKYSNIN